MMKKIIGIGVVAGVVLFAVFRSFNARLDHRLAEGRFESPALV